MWLDRWWRYYDDLEGTIWQPGWYKGEIQDNDEDNDVIHTFWYYEDWAVYSFDATIYSAFLDGVIDLV